MNRRRFLAALAAGAVVTAEGLWVPGAKLISIPKPVANGGTGATPYFGMDLGFEPSTTVITAYNGGLDAMRYGISVVRMYADDQRRLSNVTRQYFDCLMEKNS